MKLKLIYKFERWCVKRDLHSALEKAMATENILHIIDFKERCNEYRATYSDVVEDYICQFDKWTAERRGLL